MAEQGKHTGALNKRSAYPRYFLTPSGRPVSPRIMARALRVIRANPDADYPGWDWFPVSGHFILREFRRGMHDRINLRRGRTGLGNKGLNEGASNAPPARNIAKAEGRS